MGKPLWVPSDERIAGANITRFRAALSERGISVGESYSDLHQWSVEQPGLFWSAVWDYADVIAEGDPTPPVKSLDLFPGAQWFPNTRLNFAENLLRFRDERTAIVSLLENGERTETSYAQLYQQVAQLAGALRAQGVGIGDRVAAFLPNVSEAVVGMLATASIGAVWSSCSPDFGINGVQDRFGQIEPKVLMSSIRYGARRLGVKMVLVDHLGFLVSPDADDERRTIEAVIRALALTAYTYGVTIFLVCHPKTLERGQTVPTMNDFKGASAIKQDASEVIIIERDPPRPNAKPPRDWPAAIWHFTKVRSEFGIPGSKATLAFGPLSCRYADAWELLPDASGGQLLIVPPT